MFDEVFFENVLRRGLNDETISDVTIKSREPAVGKGQNYRSHMWRYVLGHSYRSGACINQKSGDSTGSIDGRETRLIIKCELQSDSPEIIDEQEIFETEIKMYESVLPKISQVVGRSVAPKCLYLYKQTNSCCIVLEDLQPLGFRTKDRQTGLPLSHASMVLESLADIHAASVYLYEQNPELIGSFKAGVIAEKTPKNLIRVIKQTMEMVVERCRDWPNPEFKKISEKLRILLENFLQEALRVTSFDETEFCVLNHGDCWTNNIMFREDEHGEPLEVLLVDYQMSVYTSPAIDLVCFLNTCPAIDIKTDNHDMFIGKYLESLSRKMKFFGCKTKPPTMQELDKAILKRRMWSVVTAISFYPRIISDEIESFDETLSTGITRMNIFKNPNATVALQKSLLFMERRGYLD